LADDADTHSSEARGGRRKAVAIYLVVVLVFTLLAFIYTRPLISDPGGDVLGGAGDTYLNMFIIDWVSHSIVHDPSNMFNAPMDYPNPYTLTYSDPQVMNSLIALPVLGITGDIVWAYSFVIIFSFILSGLAMFLLADHLIRDKLAALAAGVVFAFPLYKMAHIAHSNLLATGFIPLAFLCLHLFTERRKPVWAFLFAASAVATFLCSWAYGFFLSFAVLVYLVVFAIVKRKRLVKLARRKLTGAERNSILVAVVWFVAAVIIAGLVLLPFAIPYLRQQKHDPTFVRSKAEVSTYSPDVQDYLVAPENSFVWGSATSSLRANTVARGGTAERSLFPGLLPVLFAIAGFIYLLVRRKKRGNFVLYFYPVLLVLAAVVLLGTPLYLFGHKLSIPMPYDLLYKLFPGFKAIRAPGRMDVIVLLALALLAGFGVKWVREKLKGKASIAVAVLIAALMFFELIPGHMLVAKVESKEKYPAAYHWLATQKVRQPTAVLPFPSYDPASPDVFDKSEFFNWEPPRLLYDTVSWVPLVNGFSGFIPQTYYGAVRLTGGFPDDVSLDYLKKLGARRLVIEGQKYGGSLSLVLERAKASPHLKLVRSFSDQDYLFDLK
jgi:hypothetical protein